MAASTSAQRSTASPASQSSCFDPLDIDRYINFDQNVFPSPSLSPDSSRSKSSASSHSSLGNSNNTLLPSQPSNQQTFAGPSHQYELHKQQAGLPVGALANTLAVNQAENFQFGRSQPFLGGLQTDGFFGMNATDDYLDFGTAPSLNPSLSLSSDIDMEFGSPSQDVFLNSLDSASSGYVDPTAIGGQEDMSTPTQTPQPNPGRVWPGIHQQQAAMAKAQAEAQQKQQTLAQQSQKATHQQPRRSNGNSSRPRTDPIVEERISRLLNQMRHSSVSSSIDDDNNTPNANGNLSHGMRTRKEEEDMDEDERLLASEEGKKLSSKERRQLRNKVSARAFRSRRKEYIGQLEGEIAAKTAEADDLRVKNEELMAENTRLADLTRMLLSSSAFSTFLNDLSSTGVASSSAPAPGLTALPSSAVKSEPPQTNTRKDVNPHQSAAQQAQSQQTGPQIGMALVPETNINYSAFNSSNNVWAGNMDFSLYDAQVFTVTELPQGPAVDGIDTDFLAGKSSNVVGSYPAAESKDEAPAIERMPAAETVEAGSDVVSSCDEVELDETDPAFALFADCPPSTPSAAKPEEELFGGIELEKAFSRLELVVEDEAGDDFVISTATMERFERLCSILKASSDRITAMTSRW